MASSDQNKGYPLHFTDPKAFVNYEQLRKILDDIRSLDVRNQKDSARIDSLTQLSNFTDIYAEVPSGTTDGANVTFTLTYNVFDFNSIVLSSNGRPQYNGIDFTIKETTITFISPPILGAELYAIYKRALPIQLFKASFAEVPIGTADGFNGRFLMSQIPADPENVVLLKSGNIQKYGTDFTIDGATIIFKKAPTVAAPIYVAYNTFSHSSPYEINYSEIPTGAIDGANDTYNINYLPVSPGGLIVMQNNALKRLNVDYTFSGNTIVFTSPPSIGDTLFCLYSVRLNADFLSNLVPSGSNSSMSDNLMLMGG
jgi:hypothetical protein